MTGADLRSRLLDRLSGLAERVLGPSPTTADHVLSGLTAGERSRVVAYAVDLRKTRGKPRLEAQDWSALVLPWLGVCEWLVRHEVLLTNAVIAVQLQAIEEDDDDQREGLQQTGEMLEGLIAALDRLGPQAQALPHLRASLTALRNPPS